MNISVFVYFNNRKQLLIPWRAIPVEISSEEYSMTKMHCVRAELVALEGSARMSPVPIFGSGFTLKIDAPIIAVGQRIDYLIMDDLPDLDWTRRNTCALD